MRFLHTSDLHLGASLYGYSRLDEQEKFLAWLLEKVEELRIDTILIAGDVFDTSMPSNAAKKLYYTFLSKLVRKTSCTNIVITGGNHDSAPLLDAPSSLAGLLGIYIVGGATGKIDDEVIVLKNKDEIPEALVCAIPFLRDRDVRSGVWGEDYKERDLAVREGIHKHYQAVSEKAFKKCQEYGELPVICMGHLFVSGSQMSDGEGSLVIGNLGEINSQIFSKDFTYTALGHIHRPQLIDGNEYIRYSGSPLPMSFSEREQEKELVVLDTGNNNQITTVQVPTIRKICELSGESLDEIKAKLLSLKERYSDCWCSVIYKGTELISDLEDKLQSFIDEKPYGEHSLKVLHVKDEVRRASMLKECGFSEKAPALNELKVLDVFNLRMDKQGIEGEQRDEFTSMLNEILQDLEGDTNEEAGV